MHGLDICRQSVSVVDKFETFVDSEACWTTCALAALGRELAWITVNSIGDSSPKEYVLFGCRT